MTSLIRQVRMTLLTASMLLASGFGLQVCQLALSCTIANSKIVHAEDFHRGDSNVDGALNIADPIFILGYLTSGQELDCEDAADVDDDGEVDVIDVIFLLAVLFQSQITPPPTSPCGPDPTMDNLDCLTGC